MVLLHLRGVFYFMAYKVLNLYACLGGNRLLWNDCEVTAVELDPELARLYQERFPNDTVIIADAHQFLLDHYKEFNFIWTSPPCPTHSRARFARHESTITEYPDMKLYQEIIFLENYYDGKYCVENVIPFYEPLIQGKKRGRHLYWTNFNLPSILSDRKGNFMEGKDELNKFCEFHQIDLSDYKGEQSKIKVARNLVDFVAGKTIFDVARNIYNDNNINQPKLF